ncbi:MAG: T9SS type A sorting domain-containing protein [Bacteroidales bacterium]|nr:T9SS type A sorting domain-containing protein [Bacteroidales bacterium]
MKKILFVLLGALVMLTGVGNIYAQENIIPVRDQVAGFDTWTDTDIGGTTYLHLLKVTSSTITPAMNFDNYTDEKLNFKARTYGGTNAVENTITISISTNNGVDWTVLDTRLPLTNSLVAMDEFDLSAYNGTEVKIMFSVEGTNDVVGAGIDDISITGMAPATTSLIANPEILSEFNYFVGSGPSAEQSFTLSGTLLDNSDVIITPSTSYEVSLTSGGTFQNTAITLPTYDGTDTEVYVRLAAALTIGDYNSEIITISGGSASDITVTCNGSVSEIPTPTLVVIPDVLTGLNYLEGSGPSIEKYFTLSGTALENSDVTITPPTNYEISLTSGGTFQSTAITLPSYDGADTEVYVRLISGLAIADYNSELITISGGGASDITVTCNGSVLDSSTTPCLAEDFSGFTTGSHGSASSFDAAESLDDYTQIPGWTGYKIYSAGGEIKLGTGSLNGYIVTPAVDLSADGYVNFDYAIYSTDASVVQVFHAADGENFVQIGSDITPETDFQTISLNITGGTTLSKIKIGTDIKRAYLDNIEVYCSGIIETTELIANPTVLSEFNYTVGSGPSAEQSFTLSGTLLDDSDVIITPSTSYEVSLTSGGTFQSTAITLPTYDGADTEVYVRLIAGLAIADYNSELITITGGSADAISVECSGSVSEYVAPELDANPTSLSGFNYLFGFGPSPEQIFSVTGTNLDGSDVIITPATSYEISLSSGTGYQNTPITLPAYDGTNTDIYVRLIADLAVADYNSETITIAGGGVSDVTVTCNGSVTDGSLTPCLEEDFSGFITGSHETPSTSDAAAELDDYTMVTGWTGYKVFSAGGEIKIGASSFNGYIITPAIDLTDGGSLNFDYSKWDVDVSVIQIFHAADGENFVQVGTDITPETDFQSYSVQITGGTEMSKIKIATDVKRAYLDNIKIFCENFNPTPVLIANTEDNLNIYPNPTSDFINISIKNWESENVKLELFDIMGKLLLVKKLNINNGMTNEIIDLSHFKAGIYMIRFTDNNTIQNLRIEKK